MPIKFDYELSTAAERVAYIDQHLDSIPSHLLEYAANYILFADTKEENQRNDLPLTSAQTQTHDQPTNHTTPRQEIDWNEPWLEPYAEGIAQLNHMEKTAPTSKLAYQYRTWSRQLSMDAGTLYKQNHKPITCSTRAPYYPVDISATIDWTNSFHIKHVLAFYSALYQSESQFDIEYLDHLTDIANLKPWQTHIIARRIDGANQIRIGIELAQDFGRIISPSYMSQTMRAIYRAIADAAKREQLEWENRANPHAWRRCKICGEEKITEIDFYTNEHICKTCRKERYSNGENK
jgi:hypothetical protein